MKITIKDIKVIPTAPQGINLLVVKIITNQPGLEGVGCATYSYRYLAVKLVIEKYLKPLLVGREIDNIKELWQLMYQNSYWRDGPIENNAIAGIDIALWDLKGKVANMPVYNLLGGQYRKAIKIYRHADGNSIKEVLDEINRINSDGVKNIRCQINGYGGGESGHPVYSKSQCDTDSVYVNQEKYMSETLDLFHEIKNKYGSSINLIHDVHERLTPSQAIQFAKKLEDFNVFYLEDPLSLSDIYWLKKLRLKTDVPLAMGELFTNPLEWKYVIENRLVDYIRVHITQIGGITPAWELTKFAEQYGVKIAWHGPGDMSPIGHMANLHLDISASNFGIQEWSGTQPPNNVIQNITGSPEDLLNIFKMTSRCEGGYIYLSDEPGLGIDFDEEKALEYPCDDSVTKWTQTRLEDGSLILP